MDAPQHLPGMASYAPGWERTEVSRPVAVVLSVLFGVGLLAVPLVDAWQGAWRAPLTQVMAAWSGVQEAWRGPGSVSARLLAVNRAALGGVQRIEAAVEDSSVVAAWGRPTTLDLLLRWGGAGSEEAYVGHDRWLFYRPDVDVLDGSAERVAVAARGLAQWAGDLAERGVAVVFVPVPGKASIHPEQLAVGRREFARPLMPAGWEKFEELLVGAWQEESAARGLGELERPRVVDAAQVLWEARGGNYSTNEGVRGVFLETDSHWTPGGMAAVAEAVAQTLAEKTAQSPYQVSKALVRGVGDTARMLDLPPTSAFLREQEVELAVVGGPEAKKWRQDPQSPVLVLGDSYTNIFSSDDLGWGTSAGFAEQLSRFLGFSVDRIARNDAGALSARRLLAAEGADRLVGKKVVVWQLAMREVLGGDWSPVPWLSSEFEEVEGFVVLEAGEELEVEAMVAAIGAVPRPGTTPYADYLTAMHLTDLRLPDGGPGLDAEAVAYVFTMRDHQLTPAAGWIAPGQRVRVRLVGYKDRAGELDALNRGELDDLELMLQTPNFAEWIEPSE